YFREGMVMGKHPLEDAAISRNFEITFKDEIGLHEIGVMTVTADMTGVIQRIGNKVLLILASQAVKTFLVSIFILLIFHYLLSRHFNRIASYARNFQINNLDQPLTLLREETTSNQGDELAQVVSGFNRMRE